MKFNVGDKEYVRCEICDAFANIYDADKRGWDWFTGSLSRTYHYCEVHATSASRNAMYEKRLGPPEDKP